MSEPGGASNRRDLLATFAILGGVLAVIATPSVLRRLGPHPSAAECDALLDHYVEQVARAANPAITPVAIERAVTDARARAEKSGEIARCAADSSAEAVACAMRAGGADEVERCLQ